MKKIYAIIETGMLLLAGVFGTWLSLSQQYGWLMNVKFKWLTLAGSVLLIILAVASMRHMHKRSITNPLIFGLLFLLVILSKPFLPDGNSMITPDTSIQAGLWDQIDQTRFPKQDLQDVASKQADDIFQSGSSFTTIGVVKRIETLDNHESFALMTTLMYCCLADLMGIGIRVASEDFEKMEDGQFVMITGSLEKEETKIEMPNFRFGRAMISSTNEDYYLKPEQIMTYNRIDQLPLLSEQIEKSENSQRFATALKQSKLISELEKEGPFTIFLPVDQAITDMANPLDEMSQKELKKFLKTHMVKGKHETIDLLKLDKIKTVNGKNLQVENVNGKVRINQSRILFKNLEARNGVIHLIYPAIPVSN